MGRVADDGLVQIPDLDGDAAIRCGNRSQITSMAVPADPNGRPFRQRSALLCLKPFVKFDGASAVRKREQSEPS